MAKLIAIRKKSRVEIHGMAAMATADKRSMVQRVSMTSERTSAFEDMGFEQVAKGFSRVVPDKLEYRETNEFRRLGHVGAYLVEPISEDKTENAKELLEPDFHIMPDIELTLPLPQAVTISSLQSSGDEFWPTESGVKQAHDAGVRGEGVMIGVLDTGVDADHRELKRKTIDFRYIPLQPDPDQIRDCRGFDTNGHGTHVCGIIAGENVGVAPNVELMAASVIESETMRTSLERILIGLDWILSQFTAPENMDKAAIVNMSLGFLPEWVEATNTQSVMEGIRLLLSTLVEDFDVLPVIAIGNEGPNMMRAPGYFHEALSVGAVDFNNVPADFSGGGQSPLGSIEPDISGYGVQVLSALERSRFNRSRYARMSGTSMATPYVSGIAALIASANPGLVGSSLRQKLIVDVLPLQFPPDRVGAGLARFA
jgi:subtilisin family serine protease